MAYIGFSPSQLAVAPFAVKSFTGDGSTTTFTLDQSVPGANEANVEVIVENVQQSPIDAYTIGGGLNNSLIFSEAPVSGAVIYVIHKGESTYNLQPSTGSVTAATLDPVLRNFTVDNFTGNGSATTYTLTDTPYSANSILVTVDGIVQTATTNYTVSGTTLSFGSSAPDSGAVITVVHMGFSSGNKAVMDGSITTVKLNSAGIAPTITGGTINGATFAAGAVGTPSITTTGDTNTGIYFPTADTIAFTEGGTEAMRINSSGNVGIGTNSPSVKLHVAASGGVIRMQDSIDTAKYIQMRSDATNSHLEHIGGPGDALRINNQAAGTLEFYTSNTERMRLDSNGLLTLPYGQIKFPAAQNASSDANTLDDYEEGTWNPVLTYSVSTSGVTYNEQTGHYTKIGNMVLIQGAISVGSKGTGSGSVQISVPFATSGGRGALAVGNTQQITGNNLSRELLIETGTSYFYVRYPTGSGSTAEIQYADVSNGLYIVFSGVYKF